MDKPRKILEDRFGRMHDYLRISLADKCNLRCTYCMPEHVRFLANKHLMTREEIVAIAGIFAEAGVKKIRLTGGEPLVRKDAAAILRDLSALPVELAITTNAVLLRDYLDLFDEVGLRSINVSLDSLDPRRFAAITRRDAFDTVYDNIRLAARRGFRVKVNMVVMRGMNEDELLDFARLTLEAPFHVRFIEFMPFDGNKWESDKVFSYREMLDLISRHFPIEKLTDGPHSTSKAHRIAGAAGTFAVISTITQPFCSTCNRIRLTAEGKLRNCLFAQRETDLLGPFREGKDIRPLIEAAIGDKAEKLGGLPEFQDEEALRAQLSGRAMVKIGG